MANSRSEKSKSRSKMSSANIFQVNFHLSQSHLNWRRSSNHTLRCSRWPWYTKKLIRSSNSQIVSWTWNASFPTETDFFSHIHSHVIFYETSRWESHYCDKLTRNTLCKEAVGLLFKRLTEWSLSVQVFTKIHSTRWKPFYHTGKHGVLTQVCSMTRATSLIYETIFGIGCVW